MATTSRTTIGHVSMDATTLEFVQSVDDDQHQSAAIIDALTRLQPDPLLASSSDIPNVPDVHKRADDLAGLSYEQLLNEAVLLRRLVQRYRSTFGDLPDDLPPSVELEAEKLLSILPQSIADDAIQFAGPSTYAQAGNDEEQRPAGKEKITKAKGKRKRPRAETTGGEKQAKVKVPTQRSKETGKRVERGRRTELAKVVRAKMRSNVGIGPDDPLPAPDPDFDPSLTTSVIPNWLSPAESGNNAWIESIALQIVSEGMGGLHPSVPREDLDAAVVQSTARTAFLNFCRRYVVESNPAQMEKKRKNAQFRRRWARKDLKQKRRHRASLDPSFETSLPTSALHMDYMSSEYSSPGEDSDPEDLETSSSRHEHWAQALERHVIANQSLDREEGGLGNGKRGWAVGVHEKVLEVRTPRWRSDELNNIYALLDNITATSASTRSTSDTVLTTTPGHNPKQGHVAPSHQRFKFDTATARRGKAPRDKGEGWMWRSGEAGVL